MRHWVRAPTSNALAGTGPGDRDEANQVVGNWSEAIEHAVDHTMKDLELLALLREPSTILGASWSGRRHDGWGHRRALRVHGVIPSPSTSSLSK